MKRKICVVSGTRAEYGLLKWVMLKIKENSNLELKLIVTGTHLSSEYGNTYLEIENDGFKIDKKIDNILSSDSAVAVTKSMALALFGISDALNELEPDLLLVLGDRYEILSAVSAALLMNIPIAHLHGGEVTEGAVDDSIRHAITKMSNLHFVATESYRQRVIQMGEFPKNVFTVGGLGVDAIHQVKLLSKKELEKELNISFRKKNILVTYHPETLSLDSNEKDFLEIIHALETLTDTTVIFTLPNADAGNKLIINMIRSFEARFNFVKSFTSLGQQNFFSCLQYIDIILGNSSSGILEAPSFRKATINVGDRQKGRLRSMSVIDVKANKYDILEAIEKSYTDEFNTILKGCINPYGNGDASSTIVSTLATFPLETLNRKYFFDYAI
ncbi:MAG: UDP-N-acetylglucosamine 2-epimerase [Leptospiraceae bacterium]|nr:UDP-N-acetylglucosamine 2-epimerase [Leptospiraceae bacterium]